MTASRNRVLAGGVLSIDLGALASNYRLLAKMAGAAECGAAIKADAYGLGVGPTSKTLWKAGCRRFFVARPEEGAELRALLPKAEIYVLDGLYDSSARFYLKHRLAPALASGDEIRHWVKEGRGNACAIHVDTGINRAGVPAAECKTLTGGHLLDKLNLSLVMSHLACADEPKHRMNAAQLKLFQQVRSWFPGTRASLANSSGIFLGADYAFDLVRPGVALYGGNPLPHRNNPMRAVAVLKARVLQVKTIGKGETVGYSATWRAVRETRIAILALGYRDGYPRKLSSPAVNGPAMVWVGGKRCPIIGRVSMDMTVIDVSAAPRVKAGDFAEIIGRTITVNEVAGWAGTISYEVLTHLGSRYTREYLGVES